MRCLLIVLDSVGVGGAPDAAEYGDAGADTLGHLAAATGLRLPALWSLGLGASWGRRRRRPRRAGGGCGSAPPARTAPPGIGRSPAWCWRSPSRYSGISRPTWSRTIEAEAGIRFLGNRPASGTQIIAELGGEHCRTARPILYTSANSVLQIAAHEAVVPVERLLAICAIARRHADRWRIGRVIARPFLGREGDFHRTPRRHDFAMRPPPTILDALAGAGLPVKAVGKTADLFAGQGITESWPTISNADGMRRIETVWEATPEGLVFTNLVDFDSEYGHRRDPPGYARALAEFDAWLAGFLPACTGQDLLIITADHGNDPTFRGTDHTREEVPLILRHARRCSPLGTRDGFADIAATLAAYFGTGPWPIGRSLLP